MKRVVSNTPNNCWRIEILIGHFTSQKFPQHNTIAPDVNLFRARFIPDDFRRHPVVGRTRLREILSGRDQTSHHATVPAKLIFVLMSLNSRDVPKSEIFMISPCPMRILQHNNVSWEKRSNETHSMILLRWFQIAMNDFVVMKVLHSNGDLLRPRDDSRCCYDFGPFLNDLI